MKVSVVLSAHENSPVYRDTLESVRTYLSKDVAVLVDGFSWGQFASEDVEKIEGFRHGKASAPVRNMALGMMGAWERWGESSDWYCYMEYDCLVGSGEIRDHLRMADERGYWMLGNDLKTRPDLTMPFLDGLEGSQVPLHYLLGCCVFFSRKFMKILSEKSLFKRLLEKTNFFPSNPALENRKGRKFQVLDASEFIYPSLAVHYGGSIEQLASWRNGSWSGNFQHYPMRYRPDLSESDPFAQACVMHPLKDFENPIRARHRSIRRGLV